MSNDTGSTYVDSGTSTMLSVSNNLSNGELESLFGSVLFDLSSSDPDPLCRRNDFFLSTIDDSLLEGCDDSLVFVLFPFEVDEDEDEGGEDFILLFDRLLTMVGMSD